MRSHVLVLSGVGLTTAVAHRAIRAIQPSFSVIQPPGVPTPEDAVASLDAAGVDKAHVVGISFGACVAQELAIRSPDRVCALVLGSSTAGGELYTPPEPAVRDFLHRLDELPAEEGLWASVPYLYAATTCRRHAPLIGEDITKRLSTALDPDAYRRQLAIARAHDTAHRLTEITAPTLVIHGEQDRILPLENGRRLAQAITGARFVPLSSAHAFPTDAPEANGTLVSFLLEHSPKPRRSAARRTGRVTPA